MASKQQQSQSQATLAASAFRDCAGEEEHLKSSTPPQSPQQEQATSAPVADTSAALVQTTPPDSDDNKAQKKPSSLLGTIRNAIRSYYELWKPRLSSLVVLTTLGGYYALGGYKHDWKTQASVATGTFMQAACANRYANNFLLLRAIAYYCFFLLVLIK